MSQGGLLKYNKFEFELKKASINLLVLETPLF
jgi:hypothetical protein